MMLCIVNLSAPPPEYGTRRDRSSSLIWRMTARLQTIHSLKLFITTNQFSIRGKAKRIF